LVFVFYLYLARKLSVTSFGRFNFIVTFAAIFNVLMDFGLDVVVAKRVALSPRGMGFLRPLVRFKIQWVALVYGIFLAVSIPVSRGRPLMPFLLAGVAVAFYSFLVFLFGIFRGEEDLHLEAVSTLAHKVVFLVFAFALVEWGFSLSGVFGSQAAAGALVLAAAAGYAWKRYQPFFEKSPDPGFNVQKTLLREALPLLFVSLFTLIYFRIDTLMLSFMMKDYAVGIYSAAYKLMEGAILVPAAFMTAFFPGLARAAREGTQAFRAKVKIALFILGGLGVTLAAVLGLGADWIIPFFWGPNYFESVTLLRILAASLLVIHFNYLVTQSAVALNAERTYGIVVVVAAFLNVFLNLWLIPRYGAVGAAATTLMTEMTLGLVLLVCLQGRGGPKSPRPHSVRGTESD